VTVSTGIHVERQNFNGFWSAGEIGDAENESVFLTEYVCPYMVYMPSRGGGGANFSPLRASLNSLKNGGGGGYADAMIAVPAGLATALLHWLLLAQMFQCTCQ
jgi:hypothetical protein